MNLATDSTDSTDPEKNRIINKIATDKLAAAAEARYLKSKNLVPLSVPSVSSVAKNSTPFMKIELRDPSSLRPFPAIKGIHRFDKNSAEWDSFVDDILEHGIKHPLQITADGQVVDGETRRQAAKQLQLKEVPCEIVPPSEVQSIIIRELVQRRNLTKSQMAYTLVPLIPEAFEEARKRAILNLKNGKEAPEQHSVSFGRKGSLKRVQNPEDWSAQMGFSVQLLRMAKELHDWCSEYAEPAMWGEEKRACTLRQFIESRLFDPIKPVGLGELKRGVGYLIQIRNHPESANGGAPKDLNKQLDLFNSVVTDEINRWEYYVKFDDKTKLEHFKTVRIEAAKLPSDKCKAMADYHDKLATEFRKAAKAGQEEK